MSKFRSVQKENVHDVAVMSLGDHIEEFRHRLILACIGLMIAAGGCLFLGKPIVNFMEKPYTSAMGTQTRLQSLSPASGFTTYMQVALGAGAILSSPWVFYQLWMFVSAGLCASERRYVYMVVPLSALLFVVGAVFFVFVVAPVTLQYFVSFNRDVLNVDSNFTFDEYVSFTATMAMAFGVAFQTPIAVLFLNKMGVVSVSALKHARKYVLLGVVFAAAVITPGSDLFSLFSLAIPLYVLFELGVILCWIGKRSP
jgi:sec-independent protein translocase protein TatC